MCSLRLAWRLAYEICERPEQAGLQNHCCGTEVDWAPGVNCRCLQSVVQVLDPQVYLRSVKRHLSEKQGLPTEHQRLTFAVAAAAGKAQDAAPLPGSAEGLLAGLDTWQVMSGLDCIPCLVSTNNGPCCLSSPDHKYLLLCRHWFIAIESVLESLSSPVCIQSHSLVTPAA